jgi:hypothetical protein
MSHTYFDQMLPLVQFWKKFLPLLRIEFVSGFLLKSVLVCHLPMTVTFAMFIRIRCINSRQKAEKVSYDAGIEGLLILQSHLGQNFRFLKMHNSVQNCIPAARFNIQTS